MRADDGRVHCPEKRDTLVRGDRRDRKALRAGLARGAGFVALLAALALLFRAELLDPGNLQSFILSFGALAPFVYIALYMLAVFIPYATTVMTMAAGLAFGTLWGSLLTFTVTIFASLVPFTVSRRLGRRWVEEKLGNSRVKRHADLINRNAFLVFFYLRLLPSIPYELQNHIAGVSRITYRQFMGASALGIGPTLFVLAFLGDTLTRPASPEFWLAGGIYLVFLLAPPLYVAVVRKSGKKPFFGITSS